MKQKQVWSHATIILTPQNKHTILGRGICMNINKSLVNLWPLGGQIYRPCQTVLYEISTCYKWTMVTHLPAPWKVNPTSKVHDQFNYHKNIIQCWLWYRAMWVSCPVRWGFYCDGVDSARVNLGFGRSGWNRLANGQRGASLALTRPSVLFDYWYGYLTIFFPICQVRFNIHIFLNQ